jgi:hypothetical protein
MAQSSWAKVLQTCTVIVTVTLCAAVLNLTLANDPSTDDAARGAASGLTGAFVVAIGSYLKSAFSDITRIYHD